MKERIFMVTRVSLAMSGVMSMRGGDFVSALVETLPMPAAELEVTANFNSLNDLSNAF
jgi:hypothetical protein